MQAELFSGSEIADWRQCVAKAHLGQTFTGGVRWIRFIGGPLDGVRTVVTDADLKNQFIGWCRVHNRLGPVSAMYSKTDNPSHWAFRSLDVGVQ